LSQRHLCRQVVVELESGCGLRRLFTTADAVKPMLSAGMLEPVLPHAWPAGDSAPESPAGAASDPAAPGGGVDQAWLERLERWAAAALPAAAAAAEAEVDNALAAERLRDALQGRAQRRARR